MLMVRGDVVEVKLLDAGRIMELTADSLRSLDCQFRFKNFVNEACLVNLVPAGGGSWTRTACETLEEILEEVEMVVLVHLEMVGKSGSGTLPVTCFRL